MYKYLPKFMKLLGFERITDNKNMQAFANDSWIMAVPKTSELGRSEALSLVIVDEAALIDNLEDLWGGIDRTTSTGGKIFVLSTPKGVSNKFYQIYHDAEEKTNGFIPLRFKYDSCPWYDQEWFDRETKSMTPMEIRQELLSEFLGSGATVIAEEDIKFYESLVSAPSEHVGQLSTWHSPVPNNKYVLTLDIARGDGKDYSAFHVIDLYSFEIVAEYKNKLPYDALADVVVDTAKRYNDAIVMFDATGLGQAMISEIVKYRGYENIYYSEQNTNKYVPALLAYDKSAKPGITIGPKVRPLMIAALEKTFRERKLVAHSTKLIQELRTFVWENNRAAASKAFNDDLVMSLALFLYAKDSILALVTRDDKMTETCAFGISVGGKTMSRQGNMFDQIELQNKQTEKEVHSEALKKEYERKMKRWTINMPGSHRLGTLDWLLK